MGTPRNEPEIMRAKGRRCAADCNRIACKPYGSRIYQALELAEQAYKVHGLPYKGGLSQMENYPPDRFTWFCDNGGDPKKCVKVRDDKTGRIAVWPHWHG